MKKYPRKIEKQMQKYYQTLSEKDRRRYAAIEATKLKYGGKGYICQVFGCDYKTIARGLEEIQDQQLVNQKRIRKKGGGPKHAIKKYEGIKEAFLQIIEKHTAGSPVEDDVKWTNLSDKELSEKLQEEGFQVGVKVVKQLLKECNFRRRKALKTKAGKQTENRDDQFQKIYWLKESYHQNGNPVLSMDVKKKSR
jgi:hypothetical protein